MNIKHKPIIDLFKKGTSVTLIAKTLHKDKRLVKKVLENYGYAIGKGKPILEPCRYCGKINDLKVTDKGLILPVCKSDECYTKFVNDKSNKRKNTTFKKYGVANVAQLDSVREKTIQTNIEKYGCENPQQNKEIKEKSKQTLMDRYGVEVPCKSKHVANKMKQTNIKKYGYANVQQNKEVKDKSISTIKDKYGVDNIFKSESFKASMKERNQKLYGVDYYTETNEMKEKSVETRKDRYGVEYHSQSFEIKEKMWKTYRTNYWNTFLVVLANKRVEPLFTKEDYVEQRQLSYKCLRCGSILSFSFTNPHRITCSCMQHRSFFEDEIIDWLKSINISNIIANEKFYEDKKMKYEIDVYLPDHNIGIDFHGIYWHSDIYKDRNYHQDKYKYFKDKGIKFIQVFENEWINKNLIVKSIIASSLGTNNKIFARKCEIKEIDYKEAALFLNTNHLQGAKSSKTYIGLYYQTELVQLMTVSNYRFSDEVALEVVRFATKIGITVTGGFQKILKYVINTYQPKKIISFIDVRYFSGDSYIKSNFTLDYLTKPNYFYFKEKDADMILHSRIKFQKHKLAEKLDVFDSTKSEYDNMRINKYLRIFDAGNLRMVLDI